MVFSQHLMHQALCKGLYSHDLIYSLEHRLVRTTTLIDRGCGILVLLVRKMKHGEVNLAKVTYQACDRARSKIQDSPILEPGHLNTDSHDLLRLCFLLTFLLVNLPYPSKNYALVYSTRFFSLLTSFPLCNSTPACNTWKQSVWTGGLWMREQGWWVASFTVGAGRPVLGWLVTLATIGCEQHWFVWWCT